MNSILAPFLQKLCLVFIDDILIYRDNWDQHLEHINLVLETLRTNQFYQKQSKCCFAKMELSYLWYIISEHRVSIDPSETRATEQ
jgi:hypothetical protein